MPRFSRAALGVIAAWLIGMAAAWLLDGTVATVIVVILALAALAAAAIVQREPGHDESLLALLAFAPLHLAVLATGGVASPLLALAGVWAVGVAWTLSATPALIACGLGASLLLATALDQPAPATTGALAGVPVVVGAGWLLGAALRRATLRLRLQQRRLHAIEEESRRGMTGPGSGPGERVRMLESALDSARAQTGASRAVLWRVEADDNRVVPRLAIPGTLPRPVSLVGSPLRWVWEERVPLRLEGKPGGAAPIGGPGGACVVPVDDDTILVFDFDAGVLPADVSGAADAGRYIGALLELQHAQGGAEGSRTRFDHLLGVLERLARATAPEEWAAELAQTARVLAGGTGAAVGTWEGDEGGRVLAGDGDDGGPAAGEAVAGTGSEMALAVRAGAPIRRDDLRPGARLPVASAVERWFARPRSLAVLPLETADGIIGVLAVWNADAASIDDAGLAILRTLAPYAALQLRQLAMHDTLRARAERDALTGLPNRGAFDERIEGEVAHYRRYHRPVSVILIDVDHFKQVNDTWGHDAGDAVLRQIARVLDGCVRETDFAARLGGEEFAVILPETDLAQAVESAERIRQEVEAARFDYGEERIPVRVSGGVSSCPAVVADPTGLAASADAALYASKQSGRNRITSAGSEQRRMAGGK